MSAVAGLLCAAWSTTPEDAPKNRKMHACSTLINTFSSLTPHVSCVFFVESRPWDSIAAHVLQMLMCLDLAFVVSCSMRCGVFSLVVVPVKC